MKILYKNSILLLTGLSLVFGSCEIEEVTDPNNPNLADALANADEIQLQTLVTGLESVHRGYFENANEMFGSFGREVLPYFGSDPRFAREWLGLLRAETYPDFFTSAGTYVNPYLAVRQANSLILAANNSTFISEEEKKGYTGLAKTIKGYQLLWPLMQQYQNGIRIDVADRLNPGPILPYDQALEQIRAILDDGASDLEGASTETFTLSAGFAGFQSPEELYQLNRAIAARAALYAEDFTGALEALEESFMDLSVTTPAGLYVGPAHLWGNAPDQPNPLYYPLDKETNTILIAHPALVEDALEGDLRLGKFAERELFPVSSSSYNFPGLYQDARYSSLSDPTPFIRNEELILIYAEAQARKASPDTEEAVRAINIIRNIWNVGDYEGPTDQESLIDEILFQRRYSLWQEGGHRWIDLRRTDRLNDEYVDLRDGGNLFTQVAQRTSETNWEDQN